MLFIESIVIFLSQKYFEKFTENSIFCRISNRKYNIQVKVNSLRKACNIASTFWLLSAILDHCFLYPFVPNVPALYPWKRFSGDPLRYSDVFRGSRKGALRTNRLNVRKFYPKICQQLLLAALFCSQN